MKYLIILIIVPKAAYKIFCSGIILFGMWSISAVTYLIWMQEKSAQMYLSLAAFKTIFRIKHYKENPIYVLIFWKLRNLSPNFHIHVSVNDLYIPRIGPHSSLQQNRQTNPGNI